MAPGSKHKNENSSFYQGLLKAHGPCKYPEFFFIKCKFYRTCFSGIPASLHYRLMAVTEKRYLSLSPLV